MNSILSAIEEDINAVEQLRLNAYDQYKKAVKTVCVILVISVGIGAAGFYIHAAVATPVIRMIIPIVIGIIAAIFIYKSAVKAPLKTYNDQYKHRVIGGIAKYLQPEMKYEPDSGIPREVFVELGHYQNPSLYNTEDLFHGMIDKTEISFCEANAVKIRTYTDAQGKTKTSTKTIFKGIIFSADFHKHFNTWITISPDNESDGFFGRVAQKIQSLGNNLVKLESPEFEKHFLVRSPDDIQARYVLTPDIQQRLLDLRSKISDEIKITFRNSSLYITIPQQENWFEADLKTSVRDENLLNSVADQMQHLFQIVDIMNLNTRIWTKE